MGESQDGSTPTPDVDAIESTLAEAPVSLAVLYGSHARGEATQTSDVDLAVAFDDSLSSLERTRARLELIERLSRELGIDVDVVPLDRAPPTLGREIREDGIVIVGSRADLDAYTESEPRQRTREQRLAEFDELLGDLERVV